MRDRILGILGGMGPYASLEFNKKLFDFCDAKKDWEFIHTILDSDVTIPSRTRHLLYGEEDPSPYIVRAIGRLQRAGAEAVVLPCNSVHYFYERVVPHIGIPWLNMLEIVSDEIRNRGGGKILILGGFVTVTQKVYDPYLPRTLYLDEAGNALVYRLIEELKIGDAEAARKSVATLIGTIEESDADAVLLACTELTLSDTLMSYRGRRLFDSNGIYAQYAVDYMRRGNEKI